MGKKDKQYQKEQDALLALPRKGILESEEGRKWYNRRADQIAQDYLKSAGRNDDPPGDDLLSLTTSNL